MLRLIITLPFLILLVVFVLYNQVSTAIDLPGYSWQSSIGVIALIVAVGFFLLGALFVWFSELRQRRRARRAEATIRIQDTQIAELRAQLAQAVGQNVAYHGTTIPSASGMPMIAPGATPTTY